MISRLVLPFALTVPLLSGAVQAASDGATIYKRCAACHLATGKGVPGAFPPLDTHVAKLAETDAGRDYLIMVIASGVSGELKVDDQTYRGFMTAQPMKDDELATVLNYVMTDIVKADPPPHPFTVDEVAKARSTHKGIKAADVLKLRPDIASRGKTTP